MKRWLLALVFAALSAPSFSGTVSGTVNRPDGQPLANGTLPYTLSPTASTVARATAVTAAKFPTATIAQPSGHSLQSIARPLSLGSHDFFANAIRTTSPFYCQTNANGILFADCPIYSGADASCKIRNAIRALPGGPTAPVGIVDARNFTDVGGTGACVIDAGNGATTQTQNPVTVLLGGTTYNFSQIVLRSGFTMTGLGGYSSTGTTVQATSATTDLVVIPPGTAQPVTGVYLRGIRFLGVDGNHAENGMRIVASTGTGNGGGLWEAIFQDLTFLQFKGISIDFEATAGTTPLDRGLNQFLTLVQVRAYRVTGGGYGLQLLGADAQFDCFACQFQGPVIGDGVNVNISDSAP